MLEKMELFLLYLRAQLKKRKYDDKTRQSANANAKVSIGANANIDTSVGTNVNIDINVNVNINIGANTKGCAED